MISASWPAETGPASCGGRCRPCQAPATKAPVAHDDDALRAVRAAGDIRAGMAGLNARFRPLPVVPLDVHAGVATGEVIVGITGLPGSPATGEVINLAARLEQAAVPGEILIADTTLRLAREGIAVEPVAPLVLKGKLDPVQAYRLLEVSTPFEAPAVRRRATLQGRAMELSGLEAAFGRCVGERRTQLVTVVGEPGVGKSRLAHEFVAALNGRGRVLRCRCLSYGEGISYWPIAELVRDAAAIQDTADAAETRAGLAGTFGDDPDAAQLADVLGAVLRVSPATPSAEQIGWATRHLLRRRAEQAPLVVLVDDIQWGEVVFRTVVLPSCLSRGRCRGRRPCPPSARR